MSKPAFDPNLPFTEAKEEKPAFDPSKPFEVAKEEPSRFALEPQAAAHPSIMDATHGGGLTPAGNPSSMYQDQMQSALDMLRGTAQGFGGVSDEVIGAGQATKDVLTTDAKLADWTKLYRQHQQEQQAADEAAHQRSPLAYNVGEYGVPLAAGLLTGGASAAAPLEAGAEQVAAKLGPKALAWLAAKGMIKGGTIGGINALGHSKATIEQDPEQLAKETLGGTATGMALGGAFELGGGLLANRAASKAAQEAAGSIENNPITAQVKEAYRAGKAGEGFGPGKAAVSREAANQQNAVTGLKETFTNAEQKLLDEKKALLANSETPVKAPSVPKPSGPNAEGFMSTSVVQPEQQFAANVQPILDILQESNTLTNKEMNGIAGRLQTFAGGGLSATEADKLHQQLNELAMKAQDPKTRTMLSNLKDEVGSALESTLGEGHKQLNSEIHNLLKARETLLSRGKDVDVSKMNLSSLGNEGLKTENEIGRILQNLRNPSGEATNQSQGALDKTIEYLKSQPELAQKLGINIPKLEQSFYKAADRTALADKLQSGSVLSDIKPGGGFLGIPVLGEKGLLQGANIAGRVTGGLSKVAAPIAKTTAQLYKLPKEGMQAAGQTLEESGVPGIASLGTALRTAGESGDMNKTNAALFPILQNPKARQILGVNIKEQGNKNKEE